MILLVLSLGWRAEADSWVRYVRVADVTGPVSIDQLRGEGLQRAFRHMPVQEGMTLKTADSGEAEIQFEDKQTVLRLAPGTEVHFPELRLLESGDRVSVVEVKTGSVHLKFRDKKGEKLRLSFAGNEIRLDGSAEFHARVAGDQVELEVVKGEVTVHEDGKLVTVKKKQSLEFAMPDGEMAVAGELEPDSANRVYND